MVIWLDLRSHASAGSVGGWGPTDSGARHAEPTRWGAGETPVARLIRVLSFLFDVRRFCRKTCEESRAPNASMRT